jgi:ABC-2 type transport system ATP-binding protein/ribosome-dependent ATPase
LVANRPLSEVSLGLRRRAAFAAALSHDPGLLVLDEPTSGVGPLGRVELWNTIGEQADGGTGVLVSTHHMDEAEQCDRIVMLASGRKAAEGTAAEIVESVQAVEVNVGDWHQAFTALERAGFRPTLVGSRVRLTEVDPKRVEGILSDSGLDASVRPVQAGFEEAFVALAST